MVVAVAVVVSSSGSVESGMEALLSNENEPLASINFEKVCIVG